MIACVHYHGRLQPHFDGDLVKEQDGEVFELNVSDYEIW